MTCYQLANIFINKKEQSLMETFLTNTSLAHKGAGDCLL